MKGRFWIGGLLGLLGGMVIAVRRFKSQESEQPIEEREATGSYWVLENTRGNYVRIHAGACHLCREGQGPNRGQPGLWHGPFPTYIEARDMAVGSGRALGAGTGNCKVCKPESEAQLSTTVD